MSHSIRALWSLIAAPVMALFVTGPAIAADQPIGAFEAGQAAAWNAHDAAAYTAAFAPDADIITALGSHEAGQAEAARSFADDFQTLHAHSQLQLTVVQVRMLAANLAAVTLSWSIVDPPAGEERGFTSQLLQRHGNSWTILAQQDTATHFVPVEQFPPTAPSAQLAAPGTMPAATLPPATPPARRCVLARANHECLIYGKAIRPPAK